MSSDIMSQQELLTHLFSFAYGKCPLTNKPVPKYARKQASRVILDLGIQAQTEVMEYLYQTSGRMMPNE